MLTRQMSRRVALVVLLLIAGIMLWRGAGTPARGDTNTASDAGQLAIRGADGNSAGQCPLTHTNVTADVSGYVARVHVRQTFENPAKNKIEAVYTFPLPDNSAVDEMTLTSGTRRVVGIVKPKEEARQIYNTAKSKGKVAGLLDQERPNIFTQSVANIEPGAAIVVDISYVETLKYEDGVYEWVFPMVVGPRYNGGDVPDADKISPPVSVPGTRAGNTVSLQVRLDTGAGLSGIESPSHPIQAVPDGAGRAIVTLQNGSAIPNKDFILRYRSAGKQISDSLLTYTDTRGKYFTLTLQPPERVLPAQAVPKEMVFVIDQTGSQAGWPLEKAKETMRYCIQNLNPGDTFNLIGFDTDVHPCFPKPVLATRQTIAQALRYLKPIEGNGGTDILKSVQYALKFPDDPNRLRVVCYMTDGFVGDDMEVLDYIQKNRGRARMFPLGVGESVNRFLIDGMAQMGGGVADYVTLSESGAEAAQRFYTRVQAPVLTNITVDWGTLPVSEVYPRAIPDLFSQTPIMVHGKLTGPASGTFTVKGMTAAGPWTREVTVTPDDESPHHDALPSLWARARVADLMAQDMAGVQSGNLAPDLKDKIVQTGVDYHLMTQFTSFVAVEEDRVTTGGPAQKVRVPVETPEGMDASKVFVGGMAAPASAPLASRAGDPLITIDAPADARRVVALMPGGEIKPLVWNPVTSRWEVRFDIPGYAAQGDYAITALFVLADGTRHSLTLHYKVDTTAPNVLGRTARRSGGSQVHLTLEADPDTARVTALLPWGERVELTPSEADPHQFAGHTALPTGFAHSDAPVTYIVTDRAHNRTQITVDMSR